MVEDLLSQATALQRENKLPEAIQAYDQILQAKPDDLTALKQISSLYWRTGQIAKAAESLQAILDLDPTNAHVWSSKAMCLAALGKPQEAIASFREAIRIDGKVAAFHHNLASTYTKLERWYDAAESYKHALKLQPTSPDDLSGIAVAFSNLGETENQVAALADLAKARPLSEGEELLKAEALMALNRTGEALSSIELALQKVPDHPGALLLRAVIRQQDGRHEEAAQDLKRLIELYPAFAPPYWFLSQSQKFTEDDLAIVKQMENAPITAATPPKDLATLNLALGNAYNDLKDYEKAMKYWDQANAVLKQARRESFDRDKFREYIDDIIATFPVGKEQSFPDLGIDSGLPVFIVGMPRSGTTLTETILSSHSDVVAGGEIDFWVRYAPEVTRLKEHRIVTDKARQLALDYLARLRKIGPAALRVTDKLPFNYLHLGLLRIIFPRARFIHCYRNPVDNCISFYSTLFKFPPSFAHDKGDIVFAYRQYVRLMKHWKTVIPADRLMDVRYEDLVENQEAGTRKLIQFCGLPWQEACLHPEKNERKIATMSHWQAKQPVYKSSVERWRRYEPWLGEFQELVNDPPTF